MISDLQKFQHNPCSSSIYSLGVLIYKIVCVPVSTTNFFKLHYIQSTFKSAPPSKNHNLGPWALDVYSAIVFYKTTHEEHPVLNYFFTLKVTIKNLLFGEFHCLIGKWQELVYVRTNTLETICKWVIPHCKPKFERKKTREPRIRCQ